MKSITATIIRYAILFAIVIVLVIAYLNPSFRQFKDFATTEPQSQFRKTSFRKVKTSLFYSIFEKTTCEYYDKDYDREGSLRRATTATYKGYLLNFYEIK